MIGVRRLEQDLDGAPPPRHLVARVARILGIGNFPQPWRQNQSHCSLRTPPLPRPAKRRDRRGPRSMLSTPDGIITATCDKATSTISSSQSRNTDMASLLKQDESLIMCETYPMAAARRRSGAQRSHPPSRLPARANRGLHEPIGSSSRPPIPSEKASVNPGDIAPPVLQHWG